MWEERLARVLPRLLPGVAALGSAPAVAGRRLGVGLAVVVLAVTLQTLPALTREAAAPTIAARFAFWFVEMLAVIVALSATYDASLRRRCSSGRPLVSTLVVAALVASAFLVAFWALVQRWPSLRIPGEPEISVHHAALFGVVVGLLHCGVWALSFVFPYAADDVRMRALEADKLRIEAEQLKSAAELARLRSQLEPHFLLNTLNTIAGLVTEEPREARRLLGCLGDLLRDALRDGDELQSLEEELEWLRRYAQILESRHTGMLEFQWEIDARVLGASVPRLLLQPLVENAVMHGALRRRSGGVVTVRVAAHGPGRERLVCTVEDNGPGLPAAKPREGAFGLKSVRRRLALRCPDASLRIESEGGLTRSIVELPTTLADELRAAE